MFGRGGIRNAGVKFRKKKIDNCIFLLSKIFRILRFVTNNFQWVKWKETSLYMNVNEMPRWLKNLLSWGLFTYNSHSKWRNEYIVHKKINLRILEESIETCLTRQKRFLLKNLDTIRNGRSLFVAQIVRCNKLIYRVQRMCEHWESKHNFPANTAIFS